MNDRWRRVEGLLLIAAVAACAAVALHAARGTPRSLAAAMLLYALPGWAVMRVWFGRDDLTPIERVPVAFTLSTCLSTLIYLIAHYAIPRVDAVVMTVALAGVTGAFALVHALGSADDSPPRRVSRMEYAAAGALLLLAVLLRFPGLGYSEFQGDEAANCIDNSARLVLGEKDVLFTSRRPPVQLVQPALTFLLAGSYDEALVRLPFALAGVCAVLAMFALRCRAHGLRVGVVAGLLMAVGGFFVGFSRIVQYQAFVVLASVVGLMLLASIPGPDDRRRTWRFLSCGMLVIGFCGLSHFEGLLVLPAALWLVLAEKLPPRTWGRMKGPILMSFAVFAATVLLFYLPFRLDPAYERMREYYGESRIKPAFRFNADILWDLGGLYNTRTYLAFLAIAGIVALLGRIDWRVRTWLIWFAAPFVTY
ncbi:MAG: glycosyltransferase family 39 protein, partial [Tepidisphaeraceae bacterium]